MLWNWWHALSNYPVRYDFSEEPVSAFSREVLYNSHIVLMSVNILYLYFFSLEVGMYEVINCTNDWKTAKKQGETELQVAFFVIMDLLRT